MEMLRPLWTVETRRPGRGRPWHTIPHFCDRRADAEELARLIALRDRIHARAVLVSCGAAATTEGSAS